MPQQQRQAPLPSASSSKRHAQKSKGYPKGKQSHTEQVPNLTSQGALPCPRYNGPNNKGLVFFHLPTQKDGYLGNWWGDAERSVSQHRESTGYKELFEEIHSDRMCPMKPITVPGIVDGDGKLIEYNCVEQYMMHQKILLCAKDPARAHKVLHSDKRARAQKGTAAKAEGFDGKAWSRIKYRVVRDGVMSKFAQNDALKEKLLSTGSKTLAEASRSDCVWGIGCSRDDADAKDPGLWRGSNLLGRVLMDVRAMLNHDSGATVIDDEVIRAHNIALRAQGNWLPIPTKKLHPWEPGYEDNTEEEEDYWDFFVGAEASDEEDGADLSAAVLLAPSGGSAPGVGEKPGVETQHFSSASDQSPEALLADYPDGC